LPYLFICALIANAASFVLPISNPANLVIYGSQMPPLAHWIPRFGVPSLVAIGVTYLILRWTQRKSLVQPIVAEVRVPELTRPAKAAAWGIVATALLLTGASALGWALGMPTCVAGIVTLLGVTALRRSSPWPLLHEISWGIIPLVAGLFVLVEGLDQSGVIRALSESLRAGVRDSQVLTAAGSGVLVGFLSNLVNNLPAGLMAGTAVQAAHVPADVSSAILIGVDLGPNLSVTGSLATILWLTALRRERVQVAGVDFLKLGMLVMPPALLLSLAALFTSELVLAGQLRLVQGPPFHDEAYLFEEGDVLERVTGNGDQVRECSRGDDSQLTALVEQIGRLGRSGLDGLHRGHPKLNLALEFLRNGVGPDEAADIGAERHFHTGRQRLAK
jgi:arsenical pump membrane protein